MSVIRPGGPVPEPQLNIVKPGDTVEWPKVDPGGPIIIKPIPITVQLRPRPLLHEATINFPGDDDERDFVVYPTKEEILRISRTNAEAKQRARERAHQPLPEAKIFTGEEEPWPYAVKLSPRAPRPNLKFNPETFAHTPTTVKINQPYTLKEESIIYLPIKSTPDGNITIRPW